MKRRDLQPVEDEPYKPPVLGRKKFKKLVSEDAFLSEKKQIAVYPNIKCSVEGCNRFAVGKHDVCEKHGGDPVVKENLLKTYEVSDTLRRLSKFNPAVHPMKYIKLSQQGWSPSEIASEFGVGLSTLRGWSETFEDFYIAMDIGKGAYESWWLKEGKRNLDNRNYNTGLFKFLTANTLGFSDKMETKSLHVTAGVLAVPLPAKTPDEWENDYKDVVDVDFTEKL